MTVSFLGGTVIAQIPVEVFTGNDKATLDIMFFKYFNNNHNESSRFLFFNRNRLAIDYEMTSTEKLPQFGFTEAISYNHPKLKGFAPVFVAQVFNSGIYPKVGIQFVRLNENFMLFSWLVSEIQNTPGIDYYLLFRYTPQISSSLKLFTQIETLNTFLTENSSFSFTQRFRIGLKIRKTQFGLGADLVEKKQDEYSLDSNSGLFFRYEF
ncbi:MAG: hypothetical protein GX451_08595 [Acholeplasmataceae bacterium]|nr:hypothetical protein [Acholeplasmataceae bacterium]